MHSLRYPGIFLAGSQKVNINFLPGFKFILEEEKLILYIKKIENSREKYLNKSHIPNIFERFQNFMR